VAGLGSQILVAQTAFLLARGRASILAPTYSEHARVAELAGHNVVEVADVTQLVESRAAVVVTPRIPMGGSSRRMHSMRPSWMSGLVA
jgi:cobalamin biosynthetic protein CobC